jgi:dethiobiotin synthetase
MSIVVVTGTDTGVGKTIATAALAARAAGSVVVVKPVQTGISGAEPGDVDVVHRLTGRAAQEFTTLADPLAPDTAARLREVRIPPIGEYVDRIRVLDDFHDLVIVEGAGGLLVRLDTEGGTILDLAQQLSADCYVVTRAGLGTLNHTCLTVDALRARGLEPRGLIIGSWPDHPGLAETTNRDDLPLLTGVPLAAVLPERAGDLPRERFLELAPTWFTDR